MSIRNLSVIAILAVASIPSRLARAAPSQEDVFKSIHDNVGETIDFSRILPFALAAVAVVILLALFSQRRKREITPRALNHQGKLIKELVRATPLRPAEVRQLKLLAESAGTDAPLASPVTLLLCPSVMSRALKNPPARLDRKVIAQIARKISPPVAPARSS